MLSAACTLPSLAGQASRLERLRLDYARGLAGRDAPLAVALVGATGAGKSTLLNALAGQALSREGESRPTSSALTVYAPEGGAASADALEALGARTVRYVAGPGAMWGGQVFIDTPDLNSVATSHRDIARGALEHADVALVVMHRGSVAEASQLEFLQEFARRRALVFVLNFADELGKEARETLKAQARRLASERLGLAQEEVPVFAVSARAAQRGEDPSGEFGPFLFHLKSLATQAVAARVRKSNAAGLLQELTGRVEAALQETEGLLARLKEALARGLAQAQGPLEQDFEARLVQARGHLAHEVRRQAASRFWGPAAWGMRLTSFGATGVGAATLLARRSLPVGLAVAAASTALDAVRERTRAGAAERAVVETLEDDGTVEAAARTTVAEARALAHAAGLAPESVGVPAVGEVLAQLAAARSGAWRFTEGTAVGEAVARWWRGARWALLPLINLPLFALLAHVGYRVVRAYVQGPLLGSEYFLNAAALFLLLAGVGALLASLSLAGAARRAGTAGRGRFAAALGALGLRLGDAVDDGLRPARDAARRLLTVSRGGQ
nr:MULTISPECIES: GTPase [Myxococcaceae]